MRSLVKAQNKQIDNRLKVTKTIMSSKIVVFKDTKIVTNIVLGKLSA